MIVEFLGVSGVGKTTVAKKYKEICESDGQKVIWDTFDLYANHGWLFRNIRKSITVVKYSIFNHRWVTKYKQFIEVSIKDKRDIWKPLFNAVYLKSLLEKAKDDSCIHIFDEGSLQYLWAIKLRGNNAVLDSDVKKITAFLGLPDKLIVVEAEPEIIAERIQKRREYVRIMDNDNLLDLIISMQRVQCEIIDLVRGRIDIEKVDNNEVDKR